MTLSRHAQVEDLSNLLGLRRTQVQQLRLRQSAYLNLVGAILDQPSTDIQLPSPIATLPSRLTSRIDQPQPQAA